MHHEPMTEKQCTTLHQLIHPAEWQTINPNMSKQEASERIGQAIQQLEDERREYHRRKYPNPPDSPRRRGTDLQPLLTDEEFAAMRKDAERRFAEFQARQEELKAAKQEADAQQPTPVAAPAEAKPKAPPPPVSKGKYRPPNDSTPVEPLTKAQREELYRILMPIDVRCIDCMTKQEAWLAINQWHKGNFTYLPEHLKPLRRERIFFRC